MVAEFFEAYGDRMGIRANQQFSADNGYVRTVDPLPVPDAAIRSPRRRSNVKLFGG